MNQIQLEDHPPNQYSFFLQIDLLFVEESGEMTPSSADLE
jgi:hypothetical protein